MFNISYRPMATYIFVKKYQRHDIFPNTLNPPSTICLDSRAGCPSNGFKTPPEQTVDNLAVAETSAMQIQRFVPPNWAPLLFTIADSQKLYRIKAPGKRHGKTNNPTTRRHICRCLNQVRLRSSTTITFGRLRPTDLPRRPSTFQQRRRLQHGHVTTTGLRTTSTGGSRAPCAPTSRAMAAPSKCGRLAADASGPCQTLHHCRAHANDHQGGAWAHSQNRWVLDRMHKLAP